MSDLPFDQRMSKSQPAYLERIDEMEFVDVIRLKGVIDREMIPQIEERIQLNRRAGSTIDKNVLIDYALVEDVDSATVAFHLVRLKEYEARGFKVGFVNPSAKLRSCWTCSSRMTPSGCLLAKRTPSANSTAPFQKRKSIIQNALRRYSEQRTFLPRPRRNGILLTPHRNNTYINSHD